MALCISVGSMRTSNVFIGMIEYVAVTLILFDPLVKLR